MLWNLIRDFFVQHIFGGIDSHLDVFSPMVFSDSNDNIIGTWDIVYDSGFKYLETSSGELVPLNLSLGDWLSTTATAISITIIVVLCCLMIYKIVRLIGGLIR